MVKNVGVMVKDIGDEECWWLVVKIVDENKGLYFEGCSC